MKALLRAAVWLSGLGALLFAQQPGWRAAVAKVTNTNPDVRGAPGTAFVVAIEGQVAYLVTCAHVVRGDSKPKVEFAGFA